MELKVGMRVKLKKETTLMSGRTVAAGEIARIVNLESICYIPNTPREFFCTIQFERFPEIGDLDYTQTTLEQLFEIREPQSSTSVPAALRAWMRETEKYLQKGAKP